MLTTFLLLPIQARSCTATQLTYAFYDGKDEVVNKFVYIATKLDIFYAFS